MMNIEELRKIFCEDGLYAVCVENGNIASHYRIVCLQKNGAVDSICQCNTPFNYLFRCFELQCLSRSVV